MYPAMAAKICSVPDSSTGRRAGCDGAIRMQEEGALDLRLLLKLPWPLHQAKHAVVPECDVATDS